MLTEKDYCDYDTCVALKELRYKVPTSAYYILNDSQLCFVSNPYRGGYVVDCFYSHNSLPEDVMGHEYIDAPTWWETQKWLREEVGLHIVISYFLPIDGYEYDVVDADMVVAKGCAFKTYEEALSTAIYMAVEYIKEKNKEAIEILKEE